MEPVKVKVMVRLVGSPMLFEGEKDGLDARLDVGELRRYA
jgi:hypothetical protein